jgi:hypothetical protein
MFFSFLIGFSSLLLWSFSVLRFYYTALAVWQVPSIFKMKPSSIPLFFYVFMPSFPKAAIKRHFFQCWGSVTFWCGSGSADPCLLLKDPDPDPSPDPTSFFSDFKDAKFLYIFIYFSYNLPAGTIKK